MNIVENLFAFQDKEYRMFQSRLMPSVPAEKIIGIRIPVLRKYARELYGSSQAEMFLHCLPHTFYEEYNLHAFLIEKINDFDLALKETERLLPYIDNWATCDCFSPKVFAKHKDELLLSVKKWLESDEVYTVRYALGMLMRYYLDDDFQMEYLDLAGNIHREEYYINMMRSWFFATALAKQPEAALPWLTEKKLDVWTHNKTIQKAMESYRIAPEMKQQLKELRIK